MHEPRAVRAILLLPLVSCAALVSCVVRAPVAGRPPLPELSPANEGATSPVYEEGLLTFDEVVDPDEVPVTADALRPVEIPDAGARVAGLNLLRRAIALADSGDPRGAAVEFDRAGATLAPFGDWADLLAARAFAASGEVAEVQRRIDRIGATGAGEWAWRAKFAAMLAVGDSAGAVRAADTAAHDAGTSAERAFASARAGAIRAAIGDAGGALVDFREAMRESPTTAGGLDAARRAHDMPGLTPQDRLLVGRTLLAHGGIERGVPLLEAYAAAPGTSSAERAEVLLEAGRFLFNARTYERAERNLRAAAGTLPEAKFLLARTEYRQGRQEQGTRTFLAVARDDPGSVAAADALFLLGDLAHDEGRLGAAAEYYRQAIGTGVHNVSVADAAVRLAGMGLVAANPATASRDLTLYFAGRPRDRVSVPVIYWSGRLAAAQGDESTASARYREVVDIDPLSYYGMLAARRLGISLADIPITDPPAVSPATAAAIELAFFRMDLLAEIGLQEEANLELARLQESVQSEPAALYSVAEAMSAHGQPVAGALLGRQIQQSRGVWDDRLLRIVFQFPHRDVVVQEARRHGLDPFMVAGLIRQESFFKPLAVSPARAIGLMQVMPQTGSGLARRAGIANFRSAALSDPATNVKLGTIYLADQMNRWDGRLSDVFGSYNAGPNRVVRWRQFPEHADDEIYIERIPIAETRDYVKRLMLYGEIYRRLYVEE
jgi:soluble lytic murein transglycosylase